MRGFILLAKYNNKMGVRCAGNVAHKREIKPYKVSDGKPKI
jgi:hypothetical protein